MENINDIIKKYCPHCKESCLIADGCSVIEQYKINHRAYQFQAEFQPGKGHEKHNESSLRGGKATASRRKLNAY